MDVRLPKLGENAEGGVVVSILVKEGETVAKGQTILELENEKAVAPIPATGDGVVGKIHVKEGDRINVGQVLVSLIDGSGKSSPPPVAPAVAKPAPKPASPQAPAAVTASSSQPAEADAASAPASDPVAVPESEEPDGSGPPPAASPEVRRIARELGIDLRRIRGSESGGRIVLGDLRAYVQHLQQLAAAPKPASPAEPAPAPARPAAPVESVDFAKWGKISRKPMSILRKTISRRMVENWTAIPHVTQFDEADITELLELRKKFAADYEKKGARLTLTSFALQAAAAVLARHPIFNCSIDEATHEIVFKDYIHIGLAVDTDQGLIVPVIRDVNRKNLFELSKDVSELADKARARKVSLEELKGGTFTISNQGGIGGAHFTPIVNKPEVAILGLGKGALKAVVREKAIAQRLMLPLAISYDHRVIDGAAAARFTVDLVAAFQGFRETDLRLS